MWSPTHRRGQAPLLQMPSFKKLKGGEGYRLRIGDYRILLLIDAEAKLVDVVAIGHRKEVYR